MPATAEMTQFNTRMEKQLKQAGDSVLKDAGFTPSQAVRALWRLAVNNSNNPKAIKELLEDASATPARLESDLETERKLQALRDGKKRMQAAFEELGLASEPLPAFALDPYETLKEDFVLDHHSEQHLERQPDEE